jgi:mono/diheme cytochrome c family protein
MSKSLLANATSMNPPRKLPTLPRSLWILALGSSLLLLAGCGRSDPLPLESRPQVPGAALRRAPDPVQAGRHVFEKYGCAMCHGADGKTGIQNGDAQVPDGIVEGYPPEDLRELLRTGIGADEAAPSGNGAPFRMPGYAGWMSDAELNALLAYLLDPAPEAGEKAP